MTNHNIPQLHIAGGTTSKKQWLENHPARAAVQGYSKPLFPLENYPVADLGLITDDSSVAWVVNSLLELGVLKRQPSQAMLSTIHYICGNMVEHGIFNLPARNDYYQQAPINPGGVTGRNVRKVRDAFLELGLLNKLADHSYRAEGKGNHPATYSASTRFSRIVLRHPAEPLVIFSDKNDKGQRKVSVPEYTEEIWEMHDVVKDYREQILRHNVALPTTLNVRPANPAARIARIFNRDSLDCGGRLYCSDWQNVPSRLRPLIMIDGKHTVEIDFRSLHPNMLRLREGLPAVEDAYAAAECRADAKAMCVIALNAKSKQAAIKGFNNKHKRSDGAAVYEMTVKAMPETAKYFGQDVGVSLMRDDSNIIHHLIRLCVAEDIPVLTVHDSVICRHTDEEQVREFMQQATAMAGYAGLPVKRYKLG